MAVRRRRVPATCRRTHRLRRVRPVAVAVRARTRRADRRPSAAAPIPGRHRARERVRTLRNRVVPVHGQVGEQRDLLALVVDAASDQQDPAVDPHGPRLLVEAREHDDLDAPLHVLNRGDRHLRPGLRHHRAQAGHDPPDDDPLPVQGLIAQVAGIGVDEVADLLGDLAHRMLREVQPEQLLLPAQPFADRHLGGLRERAFEGDRLLGAHVEQRGLPADPVALRGLAGGHRVVEPEQDLAGVAERVERPDARQRLEHLPVRQAQVDP